VPSKAVIMISPKSTAGSRASSRAFSSKRCSQHRLPLRGLRDLCDLRGPLGRIATEDTESTKDVLVASRTIIKGNEEHEGRQKQ
jgi:hypothetical protein